MPRIGDTVVLSPPKKDHVRGADNEVSAPQGDRLVYPRNQSSNSPERRGRQFPLRIIWPICVNYHRLFDAAAVAKACK
jgi:hypothetical protein